MGQNDYVELHREQTWRPTSLNNPHRFDIDLSQFL